MEHAVVVHESEAAAHLRIDRELTASSWDLEDLAQVRLDHHAASSERWLDCGEYRPTQIADR
jgi:hypothetical protein